MAAGRVECANGQPVVLALCRSGTLYYRAGIDGCCPEGSHWQPIQPVTIGAGNDYISWMLYSWRTNNVADLVLLLSVILQ